MLYFDLLHFDSEYIEWLARMEEQAPDCQPDCDCPKCGCTCDEDTLCPDCGDCLDCCRCEADDDDERDDCPYWDDDRRADYWYAERAYQQRWEAYAD